MNRGHRQTRARARALTRRIDKLGTEWRAADAACRADPLNQAKREDRDRLDREIALTSDQIGNAWQVDAAAELIEIRHRRRAQSRERLCRRPTARAARPIGCRRRVGSRLAAKATSAGDPDGEPPSRRRIPRSSTGGAS
jgi:hypothetical protein